jgi:NAD(P)-dependent dehydrogenase (short-subunit alcohol dehydrogenase family)
MTSTPTGCARFKGRIVMVLGGNSGIGRASALAFAQEGAFVLVTGRDPVTLAQVQADLGTNGRAFRSDISDISAMRQLMQQIKAEHGRVDVLFVNAGIGAFRSIEEVDEAFYDEMFAINLKGPYFAVKYALELMGAGGSIVLTSSMGHCTGIPGNSVYGASKAGLRALARTFGAELVKRGIRVNCFSPGPIDTPLVTRGEMTDAEIAAFRQMICEQVPMGRFGTAEEAARSVLYLASEDAAFVTGIDLLVDGGTVSF